MISKDRVRIHPCIKRTLRARLRQHCASVNATETAVVELAIEKHIDGTADKTLLLRRLDRIGRAIDRLGHSIDLHMEAYAIWVKLWFAHTPSVPEEAKRSARSLAESRFKQYIDHVTAEYTAGRRFLQDMPHESVADEQELLEAANGEETDPEKPK